MMGSTSAPYLWVRLIDAYIGEPFLWHARRIEPWTAIAIPSEHSYQEVITLVD